MLLKTGNFCQNFHKKLKLNVCRRFLTQLQQQQQQIQQQQQHVYANHANIVYSSVLEQQALQLRRQQLSGKKQQQKQQQQHKFANKFAYPMHWMEDYEFYAGPAEGAANVHTLHGTADISMPASNVPCNGCGAHLHCARVSLPGYLPKEIFAGRTEKQLRTIVCQRCHFLKFYNIALDVEVSADDYLHTLSCIKKDFALALLIVDLLDMPSSIWPQMHELLGSKRPVFIVGNKVDLLPRDSSAYLEHVQHCLRAQLLQSNLGQQLNIKYFGLISAKAGYGVEQLITQLHKHWLHKGNVYLLGCTNVGKSSLFNILLNSDYCRPEAGDLLRKATACAWPGTTLNMLKFPILRPSDHRVHQRLQRLHAQSSENAAETKLRRLAAVETGNAQYAQASAHVQRTFIQHTDTLDAFSMPTGTQPITTFDARKPEYALAKWCYDTPGVMNAAQISNLLTTQELLLLQPDEMIVPRALRLPVGMSLFLAALGRLDLLELQTAQQQQQQQWLKVFVFASKHVPILIAPTPQAHEIYEKYLGHELMALPFGDAARMSKWPGLQCSRREIVVLQGPANAEQQMKNAQDNALNADVVLSTAGWIGLQMPNDSKAILKAWTPHACGIHLRTPALVPMAGRLIGKRIKNSLAYNLAKPFVFKK